MKVCLHEFLKYSESFLWSWLSPRSCIGGSTADIYMFFTFSELWNYTIVFSDNFLTFSQAYEEEEERRVAEEKRRNEAQALSRWYQLLSSIITRQRLNNCYGNGTSQEASVGIQKSDDTLSAEAGCKEDSRKSGGCHQDKLKDNQPTSPQSVPTEDHEHVFLLDDEMFDEESSTRTKRCKCGFSIQFEEL